MSAEDNWTPAHAPRERVDLGDVVVRRWTTDDAEALHIAVTESIDHLRPWMPWISREPLTVADRRSLIETWSREWDERRDFTMGIFGPDGAVGGTGLHLRSGPRSVDIGYWLRADNVGRGIMTRVVVALVESAFMLEDVDLVVIQHDEGNTPSGRVAERAGFICDHRYTREPQAPGETGTMLRWIRTRER